MTTAIVLIGAGGHAVSVTNVALSCGYNVIAYVDDNRAGNALMGAPIISTEQCINGDPTQNLCIAIGDNAIRERVFEDYQSKMPEVKFPSLVHTSSVVGTASEIGDGTVVMPLSNIGPNSKVGRFCIINTRSSIDHDSIMKDFASLAPGVVTGGSVAIGNRAAISICAVLKHGVNIGNDVVIGANSYLNSDIKDGVVAYGTPCREIRQREKGDPYLS